MSQKFDFKKFLPHIVAIVIFIAITLAYFHPLLNGMQMKQGDITNFKGISKEITDYRTQFHKEPLWTNSLFGGMPAYQISVLYPADLVSYIDNIFSFGIPYPASLLLLYMIGFYILLITLGIDTWLSVVGSVAFAFSSFFFIVIDVGHNSEAHAIGYMAPVLAGFILVFRKEYWKGGILTALFLALELYCNHLQITYYLMMMLLIYVLIEAFHAIKMKSYIPFLKSCVVLGFAVILAVGTNFTNLWATYDYGKYTTRGKSELTLDKQDKSSGLTEAYAMQWCYGKAETMTLMIPNFKGGVSAPIGNNKDAMEKVNSEQKQQVGNMDQYWGDQPFTAGPVYVGAIVFFLCLLGLFVIKGRFKWFLLGATIMSIMLSWGSNFHPLSDFFFAHFPAYNKFRAVSMILVIAEFTMPLLAVLTLDEIVKNKKFLTETMKVPFVSNPVSKQKLFFLAFIFTGGIALLCYLMPSAFSTFQGSNEFGNTFQQIKQANPKVNDTQITTYLTDIFGQLELARKEVFRSDSIRSFIFITLSAGLFWLYFKSKITKQWMIGTLLVFILADMWSVDQRYLNDNSFETKHQQAETFQPSQADLQIMQDKSLDYRVFNTTVRPDQDSRTSYFHKSIGGYHGAKLKRYDELMTYQIDRDNMSVLDMLNTKYFILNGKDNQPEARLNTEALGNAWFVSNYKIVENADSEIMALSNFNPAKTAIVDQRFKNYFSGFTPSADDTTASIKMLSYEPNDLVYDSKSQHEGLAVFSEIYYKDGWNAYIDGKLSPYIRVNYVLRAMLIPSGSHKIEFKFEPIIYADGEKISFASSALLILLCLGYAGYLIKMKLNAE
ncbi:MAG TPA: YfhO family protein [Bacteroidia bacterium]|nr:YfhO family protein [Bacteroidia bacterium]